MGDAENTLPPSKKRAAGVQLSRDNPGLDDDEDANGETGTFKKASDEVLASRRIVKVRRQPTSATPAAPSSNPFAGIRLVPPTNFCATSAEVTTAAESRKSVSKEVEEKNGMNMETEKGKDENDKKSDQAGIESTAVSSNAFAGSRLVPPTNFYATSAEVATAVESRKSVSKEVEGKNGMNMEAEKGKEENDKKPESKVDEAGIESTAEKEKSEADKGRDESDKKLECKVDEPGTESTMDKENNDTVSEATKPELADVKTEDGEKTLNEAKTDTDEKRNENEEKKDGDDLTLQKDGEASPFSSFQQLSSNQNAFTGLVGSGFSSSTFTFGPISNDGSHLGSGLFGSDGPKNGNSSLFSNAGTSIANRSEGSGIPSMQEVTVETGEENEKAVFTADSVMFEFLDGGWKERGKGEIKVNVSTVGRRKARLVMRARGNYRLILNASLYSDMKLTAMEKKGITFACVNSNGEGKEGLSTFALKFKDASIAEEFHEIVSVHKVSPPQSEIMPRRSSGRSAPRPAPRHAPARNPPAPVHQAPPPAPVQSGGGSMLGGLGATIAQGMAFGTGSAVAHRAVDSVLGPRTIQHETVASEGSAAAAPTMNSVGGSDACGMHTVAFEKCLNSSGNDISKCQFYMDMLNQCRNSSGSMMSA